MAPVGPGQWEFVTGQTWSLLTPTRAGISPAPENIFTALRLDTSYLAGLVYDRQPGFRVVGAQGNIFFQNRTRGG